MTTSIINTFRWLEKKRVPKPDPHHIHLLCVQFNYFQSISSTTSILIEIVDNSSKSSTKFWTYLREGLFHDICLGCFTWKKKITFLIEGTLSHCSPDIQVLNAEDHSRTFHKPVLSIGTSTMKFKIFQVSLDQNRSNRDSWLLITLIVK